jgi:hypothetical protein
MCEGVCFAGWLLFVDIGNFCNASIKGKIFPWLINCNVLINTIDKALKTDVKFFLFLCNLPLPGLIYCSVLIYTIHKALKTLT